MKDDHHRDAPAQFLQPTSTSCRGSWELYVVTGVTRIDGELWRSTWEGDEERFAASRSLDGRGSEKVEMPPGLCVSGLESDGGDFLLGG